MTQPDLSPDEILARVADGRLTAAEAYALLDGAPEDRAGAAAPEAAVASVLAGLVSEILKVDAAEIEADEDIAAYGFDSITFVALANRINERYDVAVTPALFFEHVTIGEIARHLCAAWPDRVADVVAPSVEALATAPAAETAWPDPPAESGRDPADAIAIVGMAGRMPGCADLDTFWRRLSAGDDLVSEVPPERWDWRAVDGDPSREPTRAPARWGGFMPGVDEFDPLFFGISPSAAERMDPQHRLFLTAAWQAIEDAGYPASALAGSRTGVFVGAASPDYYELLRLAGVEIDGHTSVGVSFALLANRVSHFFDLHGPSQPVDTACSASLVAVHQAVEAIRAGDCEMALAGGVNVVLSPTFTIAAGKAGMLSPRGRCRTFDAGADGYVRGEGVGVVLLKPLARALADGDPIHAVIRGSAVNHGGHTGSLTTPNPAAQADLLVRAWRRAGIDPATIGYIEAHGTGTALGDPVEINGLKRAFATAGATGGDCALGAVKTGIGHLETAAGIAGLIKTVLALRHGRLPGNLHLDALNPYIELDGSPLRILGPAGEAWPAPRDGAGRVLPRRAGVSSFGFGGTNAHVVLEEAPPVAETPAAEGPAAAAGPELVVLSARDPARLREQAGRLAAHIAARGVEGEALTLADLAYTLRTGREAMEERLALVADDLSGLATQLAAFAGGEAVVEGVYRGRARRRGKGAEATCGPRAGHDRATLARLWAEGEPVDLAALDRDSGARRIHLPVYPFARERYWIPGAEAAGGALLPLDCTLAGPEVWRFSLALTGAEYFLTDHVVRGRKTLPGVVYIEAARAAAAIAAGEPVRGLANFVWTRPVTVADAPETLTLDLRRRDGRFDLRFTTPGPGGEERLHAQGSVLIGEDGAPAPARIDLAAAKARCPERWTHEECYRLFHANGFLSGEGFRPLREMHRNGAEVVARLALPPHLGTDAIGPVLHPTLTDGALQTVLGVIGDTGGTPWLPFVMGALAIHAPLTPECWVVARVAESGRRPGAPGGSFDIAIADPEGRVLVEMRAMTFRPQPAAAVAAAEAPALAEGPSPAVAPASDGNLYLLPAWENIRPGIRPGPAAEIGCLLLLSDSLRLQAALRDRLGCPVVLAGRGPYFRDCGDGAWEIDPARPADYARLLDALEADGQAPTHILHAWTKDALPLADALETGFLSVVRLGRALLARRPRGVAPVRLLYAHEAREGAGEGAGAEGPEPLHAAVAAFARTVREENPGLAIAALAVPDLADIAPLLPEAFALEGEELRRAGEGWQARRWHEAELPSAPEGGAGLKRGGVYLVTGGAGGLGLILARHLAAEWGASLLLAGRSPESDAIAAALAELRALGGAAEYLRGDVSVPGDAAALVAAAKARFGRLDGVIHSAGVLRDGLLARTEEADIAAVLAPKVQGTLNLDAATRDEPLELFVTFSSAAANIGNAGQGAYAFANAFMDGFAGRRERQRARGERSGRTVSIAWPLWREGGMRVDAETEALLRRTKGIVPLETAAGIAAFDRLLAAGLPQAMVLPAAMSDDAPSVEAPAPATEAAAPDLLAAFQRDLLAEVVGVLKLRGGAVDLEEDLSAYGFDSLSFTELANRLNRRFDLAITPAVFFRYPSLGAAAAALLADHRDALAAHYGAGDPAQPAPAPNAADEGPAVAGPADDGAVAIIGIAGILPGSPDLDAFWAHLEAGDDLIGEVPASRWDWRAIHGDPAGGGNRTRARWGGFLDDIDRFDALFFGISPREAQQMDPQQRLFLETVWTAIEDAGYRASALSGTATGVFAGVTTTDYYELLRDAGAELDAHTATGIIGSVLPNRVSYLLNLRGPSEAIDTACSSSLVATHRAVQALRSGECELAIAGGCNAILSPTLTIAGSKAGMLSEDGRCKTFDAAANGYVRGEGVGAVLLKPLARAIADGDHIHAVIRGSAENHGGHAASLTAPNPQAQAEVILRAHERGGIDPRTVTYIEAHGTGTALGDPIEVDGLKIAFAELYRRHGIAGPEGHRCALGSLKTNIGHLEAAAGIAGVIKVVLAMRHRRLPGSLHFSTLNPYIDLSGSPLEMVPEARDWAALPDGAGGALPRRAGISSFGFGGVNAHLVLEEYPAPALPAAEGGAHLVVLSARDGERLRAYAGRMAAFLARRSQEENSINLKVLSRALQLGREPMAARAATVADSLDTLLGRLRRFADGARTVEGLHVSAEAGDDAPAGPRDPDEVARVAACLAARDVDGLAALWTAGAAVDFAALDPGAPLRRVSLPTYPFADRRYWITRPQPETAAEASPFTMVLGGEESFLADHVLDGERVVPGVVLLDMACAAVAAAGDGTPVRLRDVVWSRPAVFRGTPLTLRVEVIPEAAGGRFEIRSSVSGRQFPRGHRDGLMLRHAQHEAGEKPRPEPVEGRGFGPGSRQGEFPSGLSGGGEEVLHAEGRFAPVPVEAAPARVDLAALREACPDIREVASCYDRFAAHGLDYGPSFRVLESLRVGAGEALAALRLPEPVSSDAAGAAVDPALLEGALQSVIGLIEVPAGATFLPFALGSLEICAALPARCFAHARSVAGTDARTRRFDIDILDADGRVLARLGGFAMRRVALAGGEAAAAAASAPVAEAAPVTAAPVAATVAQPDDTLRAPTEAFLKAMLAAETRLEASAIRTHEPLERYGIDSMLVVALTRALEKEFGELSKTLFFEYQTVGELAGYFLEHHADALRGKLGVPESPAPAPEQASEASRPPHPASAKARLIAEPKPAQPSPPDGGRGNEGTNPLPPAGGRGQGEGGGLGPASVHHAPDGPIAIVGLAGRYPQAGDLDAFWENLRAGRDSITEIPPGRWDWRKHFDPEKGRADRVYSKWGGFIDGVDEFDPLFFGITPREAEILDPQERLFLQTAWHAAEDAGYSRASLAKRRVGVFVGVMWGDYQLHGPVESAKGRLTAPSASYASIANRVSYTLDLTGPCVALDTMCSSSLTAIHFACDSLRRGESEMAIAGGVNVSVHPQKYIRLSQGRFAASDGRCRSFGEGGDGYVPGEGVGAVLLKPLSRAEADGDHIHGVIRASAINHGGKTNGYTVPNPNAQGALIAEALGRAGVEPGTISYLEAHGTGTSLGDPIEIAGLSKAFEGHGREPQYCAIGSVKSNIGHLESAAGIAGLTKVLLQMRHGELVPSIHSETLNPNIRFETTPFRVQREVSPWGRSVIEEDGREVVLPRRAGLSSFGAGGSNAHLVIEEYVSPERETAAPAGPQLVVLSGRDEAGLRRQAESLAAWLAANPAVALADLAHTLRVGREALDERLAMVVPDTAGLQAGLAAFLAGDTAPADLHRGRARSEDGLAETLIDGEEGAAFLRAVAAAGRLGKLAALWVAGVTVDWSLLPGAAQCRRVSLPVYPFARERYWVPLTEGGLPGGVAALHPLLDANVSTLREQRYAKSFGRDSVWLADHRVGGTGVLPGAVSLEMARAAAALAGFAPGALRDVVWSRPIALGDGPVEAWIALRPAGEGLSFEVGTGEDVVHAEGRIDGAATAGTEAVIDFDEILSNCPQTIDIDTYYDRLAGLGLAYGPALRGLASLRVGDGEAAAELALPDAAPAEGFVLHPALMDAALQMLAAIEGEGAGGYLPYGVEAVSWTGPLPPRCRAHARRVEAGEGTRRYDLVLADGDGRVLVRLDGLSLRAVRPAATAAPETAPAPAELLYLRRAWREAALPDAPVAVDGPVLLFGTPAQREALAAATGSEVVLVRAGVAFADEGREVYAVAPGSLADHRLLLESLEARGQSPRRIVHAWAPEAGSSLDERLDRGIRSLFALARALLERRVASPVRLLAMHPLDGGEAEPADSALAAFLRVLRQENPNLVGTALGLEDPQDAAAMAAELAVDGGEAVRRIDGKRLVHALEEHALPETDTLPLREGGVCLVTGGAGGLGLIVAEHLARTARARVVLAGRSAPTAELEATLSDLNASLAVSLNGSRGGASVEYRQADVSDAAQVEALTEAIRGNHGGLHGVIHAAGVLRDGFVLKKDAGSVEEVLAPKLYGAVNLDAATHDDDLDCFVLFSSIAGTLGNVGQADYAYANAFLDALAERRGGNARSIAWPLWDEGGMTAGAATIEWARESFGVVPLATASGLAAFDAAVAGDAPAVAVLSGDGARMRAALLAPAEAPAPAAVAPDTPGDAAALKPAMLAYLRALLAEETRLPEDAVLPDEPLERYGIDSVMVLDITRRLEADFGKLSATLLFEHRSLSKLADHLIAAHGATVARIVEGSPEQRDEDGPSGPPHPATAKARLVAEPKPSQPSPPALRRLSSQATTSGGRGKGERGGLGATRFDAVDSTPAPRSRTERALSGDIAIVGIAGRYPGAADLEEFWDNLAAGRDAVTEIPPERWDADAPEAAGLGRWGGFLDGVDRFDPLFFRISPREARLIDPQERLFLETAWHALEDAGCPASALRERRVGVFAGVMWGDYQLLGLERTLAGATLAPGASYASIANRVSYAFDLRGPSMAVDTMCSSSLSAIHLARESLLRGESEYAIAGGVNLSLHPQKYRQLAQGNFTSSDGRCRAFGEGGDGYVPGEGVGAVLLRPLEHALADGDRIHAVIRASAVNHGGRTNGYTVPNPEAQRAAIAAALTGAGIDPASLGYVEAHGTGTALGDPIEIAALAGAFEAAGGTQGVCAIGSVKSNIGHLESAAGIAGLTKIVLQLHHRRLVPSLHAEATNPHIDFEETPFRVQRTLADWPAPEAGPRRAGLSSFGAGGSNAHLIVEEYVEAAPASRMAEVGAREAGPQLVVLSAFDAERLADRVRQLASWLETNGPDLAELAWTLLTGREAMDERLAVVAEDLDELRTALRRHLAGETGAVARGRAKRGAAPATGWDLGALAEAWVGGAGVDWAALREGAPRPRRIGLPLYPFARERCWLPDAARPLTDARPAHPLVDGLDRAASLPGAGLVYTKRLRADAPVVADHRVRGVPVLPGVGYLEMARAVAAEALGGEASAAFARVVWLKPLAVEDEVEVRIALRPQGGDLAYEIATGAGDDAVLHGKGVLRRGDGGESARGPRIGAVSIEAIRERCPVRQDGAALYERFAESGLAYGPWLRGIAEIWRGEGEALARLVLPEERADELAAYGLHPCLMDSALQALAGIAGAGGDAGGTVLSFAVERVELLRPLGARGWVHARAAGEGGYHLSVLDEDGTVCVEFTDVAVRAMAAPAEADAAAPALSDLLCTPVWREAASSGEATPPPHGTVLAVDLAGDGWLRGAVVAARGEEAVIAECGDADGFEAALAGIADLAAVFLRGRGGEGDLLALFGLLKALATAGRLDRPLALTVVSEDACAVDGDAAVAPFAAGLAALAGAAAKEHPGLRVAAIDIARDERDDPATLAALATRIAAGTPGDAAIRRGRVFEPALAPLALPVPATPPFRKGGAYLILGGAGGIGAALSLHLARTAGARLAWVGRRAPDAAIARKLEAVAEAGGEAVYLQADASDAAALAGAVAEAKARFGALHGVFHAAMDVRPLLLSALDAAGFRAALAAKTAGAENLYRAVAGEELDFLAYFSSAQSLIRGRGMGHYAAASAVEDALAGALAAEAGFPVLAIDWGVWGEAGAFAEAGSGDDRRLAGSLGFDPIGTAEAMAALERILAHGAPARVVAFRGAALAEAVPLDPSCALEALPVGRRPQLAGPARHLRPLPFDPAALARLAEASAALAAHARAALLRTYREMGAFARAGEAWTVDGLAAHLGVTAEHRRLLAAHLAILAAGGFLARDGDRVEVLPAAAAADLAGDDVAGLDAAADRLAAEFPDIAAHLALLRASLAGTPAVMRGESAGTDVLFPGGGAHLVEAIYRDNASVDWFNALAARAVAAFARVPTGGDGPPTILEIGAGTGGTSAPVLETLANSRRPLRYLYTDKAPGFLQQARRRFGAAFPFAEFAPLDIEADPRGQGFAAGGCDLVLAANVLHATRDLRATLRHAKALLKTNGWLVLCETTAVQEITTLTFGLLDGWWRFDDPDSRQPGSPLPAPDQWARALRAEGFRAVRVLTHEAPDGYTPPQHVILAESDGLVARHDAPAAAEAPAVAAPARAAAADGDRHARVAAAVAGCLATVLEIEGREFDPETPFTDFGVDSILAVEVVERINERLGIALRTTDVFNYPDIARMTARILDAFGDDLAPPSPAGGNAGEEGEEGGMLAVLRSLSAGEIGIEDADQLLVSRP